MDIGSRIKTYRDNIKISQEELAERVFVSRQTISNWETNKNYPDIKSLSLLSNIFNVSLDEFIKGDIEKMKKEIDESEIKKFNLISLIFTGELIVMIFSAYPLFKYLEITGMIIWAVIFIITFATSLYIEKYKNAKNIQTYKEIVAFVNQTNLTPDEKKEEKAKKPYQRILIGICSALITLVILLIMKLILG
ncbi:MAG TPA: helix-turn-helix transcriptional regulator [Bacilli bacterium]|nr:helix-turn-helix transcriptional regulator [Bacilli bacterium]